MRQRGNKPAILGLVILLVGVLLIAGFLIFANQNSRQLSETAMPAALTEIRLTVDATLSQ